MPRKIRIEFPGAIYHLVSRGDGGDRVFDKDEDRLDFLKTLGEACEKTGWRVHAYCLLKDHFHLVVETPNANLVAGMRWLLGSYTIRFNNRRKKGGHVFSGRYKSLLVDGVGNGYLKTVCDYVHLNPVRAKLLKSDQRLSGFPWSSYGYFLAANENRPQWIRTERLLKEYGIKQDTAAGRKEFGKRMELRRADRRLNHEWKEIRRGWCFGSEEFRKAMLEKTEGARPETLTREMRKATARAKAERIVVEELGRLNWKEKDLKTRRKGDPEKMRMAVRLRKETILTVKEISLRLNLGTAGSATTNLSLWMKNEAKKPGKRKKSKTAS